MYVNLANKLLLISVWIFESVRFIVYNFSLEIVNGLPVTLLFRILQIVVKYRKVLVIYYIAILCDSNFGNLISELVDTFSSSIVHYFYFKSGLQLGSVIAFSLNQINIF